MPIQRGGSRKKTSQRLIEAAERQAKALTLRKAGLSFEQIANQLGYADAASAYNAVKAALEKTLQEPAQELRDLECARLDAMLMGLWKEASTGRWLAVDRVLAIMDRRAKLLGLDAPTKQHTEQTVAMAVNAADASRAILDNPDARRLAQQLYESLTASGADASGASGTGESRPLAARPTPRPPQPPPA